MLTLVAPDAPKRPLPSGPKPKPKPKPSPMALLFLIMSGISGPGLALYTTARIAHRAITSTGRAEAEVQRVRMVKGNERAHYCPTLRWSHDGKTFTAESSYCGDEGEFEPGQKLRVRYDPGERTSVVPDRFTAAYEAALILLPASLFFSMLFAWQLIKLRRRR